MRKKPGKETMRKKRGKRNLLRRSHESLLQSFYSVRLKKLFYSEQSTCQEWPGTLQPIQIFLIKTEELRETLRAAAVKIKPIGPTNFCHSSHADNPLSQYSALAIYLRAPHLIQRQRAATSQTSLEASTMNFLQE